MKPMTWLWTSAAAGCLVASMASAALPASNPFAKPSTLPFQAPQPIPAVNGNGNGKPRAPARP